ncbi:MAG: hypothetical protein HYV60_05015, partial [Planctomycetia bacterium]|nr:hypothetical protein [Planctomycetia bacterium]
MTVWHSLVALRKRDQRRKSRRGNPQPLRRTLLLESLEDRRLLAYSATIVATVVTLSGDAAADTLTIDQDGAGLLRHNRFTAGEAGFVSDNDFISGNATDDTILASTVTDLAIADAGSNDSVVAAQSPAAAASTLNLSAGALSMSGFTSITDDGNLTVGGAASFTAATITLGEMSETTNFATLTFASAGAVTIQEDSSTAITGTNTAGSVSLTSDGAITDTGAMTSVTVTNDLIFNAGANSIVLADAATDVLSVGGNASFSGSSITIDSLGTANFATLTFTSTGAATINEDSSTALVGTSSGTTITVNSAGAMTDSEVDAANEITGTDLTLTGVGGIGAAGQPIHVAVTNLDVSNTTAGGIFVTDTAGGLTLTDLGGP